MRNNRLKIFVLGCALLLVFLWARPVFLKNSNSSKTDYNVIIICLDTLRADHVSSYGYFRKTTPNIDVLLAVSGISFSQAIAQSSFTLPSHTSLFTSKYVHTHKVDRLERRLGYEEITLAQVLRANGYKTAAFIFNAWELPPAFGLNKGFDEYSYGEEDKKISFERTIPQALKWINKHRKDKFFVFLHSNDIHEPYHSIYENFFDPNYKGRLDDEYMASGTPFQIKNISRTPREIQHIIAHYDGGIKYADEFVGKFIRQLGQWRLLKKTIVILLSDHGEILADRGMQFCHGFSVHDEEVHVPLNILHPGLKQKGKKIKEQVQLIDVMPTILDFLNIKAERIGMEGKSLVPLIDGKNEQDFDKYAYAECLKGESEREGVENRQVMVRTPSWKLIASTWKQTKKEPSGNIVMISKEGAVRTIQLHNFSIIPLKGEDGYELYDLKKDPKETNNLINQDFKDVEAELLEKIVSVF